LSHRQKKAAIAMFVYLSILNLCWKFKKIVEQKHFVCSTILYLLNKKNLTLILTMTNFMFISDRKVISYRLCRIYFLRRLYGYDAHLHFLLSLSQFKMAYFSVGFRFDYFYCRSIISTWEIIARIAYFFRYVDWVLTVPLMCLEFY
jgi:hypothetical protein